MTGALKTLVAKLQQREHERMMTSRRDGQWEHDSDPSFKNCRHSDCKLVRDALSAQGPQPSPLIDLYCEKCDTRLHFDTVDLHFRMPVYDCPECGHRVRVAALYYVEQGPQPSPALLGEQKEQKDDRLPV